MKPQSNDPEEHIKALDKIQDRMIEAGLIVRHAHSQQRNVAEFTPDGQEIVTTIYGLNHTLGPLTPKEIVYFWKFIVESAEYRIRRNRDRPPA